MPARHAALLRRSLVAALPAASLSVALLLGTPASASSAPLRPTSGSSVQLSNVPAGVGLKSRVSATPRPTVVHPVVRPSAATARAARAARIAAAKRTTRARVLRVAASLRGRPYHYGAAGPRSFDCSGFTRYVFRLAAHRSLPHSSAAQYALSHHISRSAIRPGDLVFFTHHGHVYHVGIYAGNGLIWHAPHTGDHVRLAHISTSSWVAGRVL
jgi:cell wall-associated NlpC family hydrolase